MNVSDDVTVVVVTYNSAHCIARLAEGLRAQTQIIFADNGSADDTIEYIHQHLPQAQIIALQQNLGFGAANNRALAQVKTPYALLLNPDCTVTPTIIQGLLNSALQYPDAAIIAPQLLNSKQQPAINYTWAKHLWRSKGPGAEGECCVGFATGAAMLLLMENTRELGYFDESFFLYYEDDDLCNKYLNARKAIIVTPSVQMEHSSRGSVRTQNRIKQEYWRGYHHAQSKVLIAHKYQGEKVARKIRVKTLFSGVLVATLRMLTFNFRLAARMAGRAVAMTHTQLQQKAQSTHG